MQAIPAPGSFGPSGVMQVVPPAAYEAALKKQQEEQAQARAAAANPAALSSLASYIRGRYDVFRVHRNDALAGWSERMLNALRCFNGQYDANKLSEIRKFGGSEVYARLIAMKARGATSLLRDVYLSPERPWGLGAPSDPEIPESIASAVKQLVFSELQNVQQTGGSINPNQIRDRLEGLMEEARNAAKRKATQQARIAEDKVQEILTEGGFYKALAEFLVDLPLFPFACIKGPIVRVMPAVSWKGGKAAMEMKPRLCWARVSPFDLWFTPGVSTIDAGEVIEKERVTRADLNDCLDLPGYNHDEVRAVLQEYGGGGLVDQWDVTDAERAVQEARENPLLNRSGLITTLRYSGNVQGQMLLDYGLDQKTVPDADRDYMVQAWLIGTHVIKAQLAPNPRKRHDYYITSFEKVPGTPVGNALPDILSDIQDVANATLRSLVNNLSISSGPQVVISEDRLAADEDGEDLFPWKRWRVRSDPMASNTQVPISFFQPTSNAGELLQVYQAFSTLADELSAIPKYLSGASAGGPGRTASGLAMLMNNASKILQTVCSNVDREVIEPSLHGLFDMLMLTDESGMLTGEEEVRVLGVNVAMQRETERSRQLELLQITGNPIDMQIIGPKGRAALLRGVAQRVGLDGEEVVPSEEEIEEKMKAAAAMPPPGAPGSPAAPGMADAAAQAQGSQTSPAVTGDMGPRTNMTRPRIAGVVG